MDVTRLTGALRAAEDRAPGAREVSPGFETFLPADDRAPSRRIDGDRHHPADDARRVEQAERRRADTERIRERRDAERESAERASVKRTAERRQAARADGERRADRADSSDDERRPLTARDPEQPDPAPTERARSDRPEAARAADPRDPSRSESPDATDDAAPLAGALGLGGLVEWLKAYAGSEPHPGAAARASDGAPQLDRPLDAAASDDILPTIEAEAPDAPEAEFARLLEGRKLSDALSAAPRRAGDSVRLGPRPATEALPAPPPLIAATRITDAGAAARAGTTPTALPEGVDESSIMRQISDALRLRGGRAGKAQTADIQLHPAELGRVRVRIHMEHGAARVVVSAEHAAVGDLLGAGLDQLRRDLMAHGVQIAHLEVESGLTDDRGQQREAPEHDETDARERPPEAPRPTARRPRGRIDLEA